MSCSIPPASSKSGGGGVGGQVVEASSKRIKPEHPVRKAHQYRGVPSLWSKSKWYSFVCQGTEVLTQGCKG